MSGGDAEAAGPDRRRGRTDAAHLDRLAGRVIERCADAALAHKIDQRATSPVNWHLGLPADGLPAGGTMPLAAIATLFGQAHHRLVVLGSSGSGKTVLLDELAASLTRQRPGGRAIVPVSIGSWLPDEQDILDFFVARLMRDYAPSGSDETVVRRLVAAGLVVPLLDEFDAIPARLTPPALQAIAARWPPPAPIALASAPEAFAEALTPRSTLPRAAVLMLDPLRPVDIARQLLGGLTEADGRWEPVIRQLADEPQGPLARALGSPAVLRQVQTLYAPPNADPKELCHPAVSGPSGDPDGRTVATYVADGLLSMAYPDGADRRSLAFLADHLQRAGARELEWWQIDRAIPTVVSGLTRQLGASLLFGLLFGLAGGLLAGSRMSLLFGLGFGLGLGLWGWAPGGMGGFIVHRTIILMFGVAIATAALGPLPALAIGGVLAIVAASGYGRWLGLAVAAATPLTVGLVLVLGTELASLGAGIFLGLLALIPAGLAASIIRPTRDPSTIRSALDLLVLRAAGRRLVGGTAAGLFVLVPIAFTNPPSAGIWLVSGLAAGLTLAITAWLDVPSLPLLPPGARTSFQHDLQAALVSALATFGVWFVATQVAVALWTSNPRQIVLVPSDGLQIGIALGAGFGISLLATRSVGRFAMGRLWLVVTGRLPWRVLDLLEDAAERGVLVRSGSAYRFRHAAVRDRLAAAAGNPTRA